MTPELIRLILDLQREYYMLYGEWPSADHIAAQLHLMRTT